MGIKKEELRNCPDCAVKPGENHLPGCDVERCGFCGGQMISCSCLGKPEVIKDKDLLPWTGQWPGDAECEKYGLYSKMVAGKGWVSCSKDDPEAGYDLNTLYAKYKWDKKQKTFVPR